MTIHSGPVIGALALMSLLVGAVGTTALAAGAGSSGAPSVPAETQAVEADSGESGEKDGKEDGERDTEEIGTDAQQTNPAGRARISQAEAITAAEAAYPGCTFTFDELDSENGVVIYSLKGVDAGGAEREAEVNALDGSVVQDSEAD